MNEKKQPGWFSRRHETNTAHLAAVAAYKAKRGPAARRERAARRRLVAGVGRARHGFASIREAAMGAAEAAMRATSSITALGTPLKRIERDEATWAGVE